MPNAHVQGEFYRATVAPHKDPRLEGTGAISVEEYTLTLDTVRRPGGLATLFGIIFAIVGLVLVVGLVMYLEEARIIAFMRIRKGPLFVGMMGLFALIFGYTAGGWIADRLFSKKVSVVLPSDQLREVQPTSAVTVQIIYTINKRSYRTNFRTPSADQLEPLLAAARILLG